MTIAFMTTITQTNYPIGAITTGDGQSAVYNPSLY
jgi:hypothetical protein